VTSTSWKEFFARMGGLSGNQTFRVISGVAGDAIRFAEENPNAAPRTRLSRAVGTATRGFDDLSREEQALRLRKQRETVEKTAQEYKARADKGNLDRLILQSNVLAEMNRIYYSNAEAVVKVNQEAKKNTEISKEALRNQKEIQRLTDLIQRDSLSKFDQKLFDINKKYDEIFSKIKDEGLLGIARENMNAEKMKVHLERIVYL